MASSTTEQTTEHQPDLKRVMGPGLLLLFIVGDILGAGVYAVTGQLSGIVGGIVWLPFLVAFAVATVTAFSYLELVTKYPQAAGAALYTHKAFGIHFVTFLVAFTVVCSGITSASTSSNLLAANLLIGLGDDDPSTSTTLLVALATLGLTVLLYLLIPKGLFPTQDTGQLQARVEAAQSVSYQRMSELQQAAAEAILQEG